MNKIDPQPLATYEHDFALWSAEQATLLRAGKLDRADLENIAEEIEGLGKSEKREIRSRLAVLLMHLLKWNKQPEHRSRSWMSTINQQRAEIALLIEDSPSLRSYPGQVIAAEYPKARKKASEETTVYLELFPETCPFTTEQVLSSNFWPGDL